MSHHATPDHTYHFSSLFPLMKSSLGILGLIDRRRDHSSFDGKKGLKFHRGVSYKNIKS
jgi:hypothetical protein